MKDYNKIIKQIDNEIDTIHFLRMDITYQLMQVLELYVKKNIKINIFQVKNILMQQ